MLAGARRPLVGRSVELAAAETALGEADRAGVVIVGEAGVGKSRLAQECEAVAEASGFAVLVVQATRAASSIPLAALAPVLTADLGALGEGVDAVRSAAAAITARARHGPLLMIVDDAHLLDHISATVVLQVAGRAGVRVVATVRSGAAVPDPITALWKDGQALRLDLAPLERDGVERIAEDVLGGRLHPALVQDLWRLSAGNALFVRELVQAARGLGPVVGCRRAVVPHRPDADVGAAHRPVGGPSRPPRHDRAARRWSSSPSANRSMPASSPPRRATMP